MDALGLPKPMASESTTSQLKPLRLVKELNAKRDESEQDIANHPPNKEHRYLNNSTRTSPTKMTKFGPVITSAYRAELRARAGMLPMDPGGNRGFGTTQAGVSEITPTTPGTTTTTATASNQTNISEPNAPRTSTWPSGFSEPRVVMAFSRRLERLESSLGWLDKSDSRGSKVGLPDKLQGGSPQGVSSPVGDERMASHRYARIGRSIKLYVLLVLLPLISHLLAVLLLWLFHQLVAFCRWLDHVKEIVIEEIGEPFGRWLVEEG